MPIMKSAHFELCHRHGFCEHRDKS